MTATFNHNSWYLTLGVIIIIIVATVHCDSPQVFRRDKNDEWFTSHCDRDIWLHCVKYRCTIKKNKNVVINEEKEHLPHADPVIKSKRYV